MSMAVADTNSFCNVFTDMNVSLKTVGKFNVKKAASGEYKGNAWETGNTGNTWEIESAWETGNARKIAACWKDYFWKNPAIPIHCKAVTTCNCLKMKK